MKITAQEKQLILKHRQKKVTAQDNPIEKFFKENDGKNAFIEMVVPKTGQVTLQGKIKYVGAKVVKVIAEKRDEVYFNLLNTTLIGGSGGSDTGSTSIKFEYKNRTQIKVDLN